MKSVIYYIIPILVLVSTIVGRFYYLTLIFYLDAFSWTFADNTVSIKSIFGTILFLMSIVLILKYLLCMGRKSKNDKVYSFFEKVLVVVAISLFIEITVNGLLILCSPFTQFLTFLFTIPLALVVSYFWIVLNAEEEL